MTPEDFLNKDFNKMQFSLDPGRLELVKIRLALENKWYSLSIMKNQIRILEFLKNGNIDEENVKELFGGKLKSLDDEIQKELADKFAFISSKTN
jgi:hypothetical protein